MEIIYIVIFGLLGAAIGSFLNVIIDRLPANKSIVSPPSSCDACQHRLSWPDMFPIFSYLFLRGRCRYCKAKIPQRVFWVELGTGLLTALLFWKFGWKPILAAAIVYSAVLIAIAVIDLNHQLILNKITYPFLLIALVVNFLVPNLYSWHNLLFGLLGGAVGFLILFVPALIYRKGMGLGDVKMAALIGLMTGFPNVIVAVFGGIILGGVMAIILLLFKKKSRKEGIPFGPYLSLATIITFFYGSNIIHWYLHLAHFE